MANNAVTITFAAQIGEFLAGVDSVKSSIEGIGSAAKQVAAAVGIGFSAEQIESFVSGMANLGEKTESAATILGVSAETAQEFGVLAKLGGRSAEEMTASLQHLELGLQRGAALTSQQAAALRVFGLTAKEMAAVPIDKQINLLADAYKRLVDEGQNPINALNALGRSLGSLAPLLAQGSAGVEQWRQRMIEVGAVVDGETTKSLASLSEHLTLAKAAMTGLGETIVGSWSKGLSDFADEVATAAGNLSALIKTGSLTNYVLEYLGDAADLAGAQLVDFAWSTERSKQAVADATQALFDLNRHYDEVAKNLAKGLNFGGGSKPVDLGLGDKAALAAQITQYQTMVKQADAGYDQLKERYAADVSAHRMSLEQETQDLLAALAFRHDAEDRVYAAALQAAEGDATKYAAIQKEKVAADNKFALQHAQIIDEAVKKEAQQWESVLQPIESAFNSQLRSLLAGTETFGQAFKKILGDLLIAFIEWCEKQVMEWAATQIAMAVIGTTTNKATNLPAIQGDVGQAFAGFAAFLAPMLGPAAIPTALGMATAMEATAIGLASADVGGYVLSDGALNVHAGETITPAAIAQPYQGGQGAGAGGPSISFNGIMIGTQAFFNQFAQQIARSQRDYLALNPSAG